MAFDKVRIADCCIIKPPKSEARKLLKDTDKVSFVPMRDLGIDSKYLSLKEERALSTVSGSYTYFADNDVLLAKITPCFENGKLGVASGLTNGVGFGSSEFIVLRSKGKVVPNYLYYFLSQPSFRLAGQAVMTGAVGHRRVPNDYIENTEIPLPSISEQERIVAILDETFADIEQVRAKTEQNLKNARELFESYLQQVFSKDIKNYNQVALAEITKTISDGDHSAPPKSSEGIPFITISNIDKNTNEIDFSSTFKVPEDYYEKLKPNRKPIAGDVLYTVTGSYGIPVLVKKEKKFCFQRHIGLIRPNSKTESEWLYYLLMSPIVFKQAEDGATGTAQKTVSLKVLRNILVPETPLGIQKEEVKKLKLVDAKTKNLESVYSAKLAALEELKKSILQKAFSGELTKTSDNKTKQGALA